MKDYNKHFVRFCTIFCNSFNLSNLVISIHMLRASKFINVIWIPAFGISQAFESRFNTWRLEATRGKILINKSQIHNTLLAIFLPCRVYFVYILFEMICSGNRALCVWRHVWLWSRRKSSLVWHYWPPWSKRPPHVCY